MPENKTTPKTFCFVLMPFNDAFADVYEIGIKEACDAAGAYCERVDEQIFVESMLDRIYNQIAKADVVIADMTDRNPNVFYEVGYAHALGKRTVLLTRDASDIPFDLKHFPHIVYGDSLSFLRDELTKRIERNIANPPSTGFDQKIELNLYHNQTLLDDGSLLEFTVDKQRFRTALTIHNTSPHTFDSGSFKVGVITTPPFGGAYNMKVVRSTSLPDGNTMYSLKDLPKLFPYAHESIALSLDCSNTQLAVGKTYPLTIRFFTPAGSRDFNLQLLATAAV